MTEFTTSAVISHSTIKPVYLLTHKHLSTTHCKLHFKEHVVPEMAMFNVYHTITQSQSQ